MHTIGLYGNIALERTWCEDCDQRTFVVRGIKRCCGRPSIDIPTVYKRVVEPEYQHRVPPKRDQEEILKAQDGRCLYCNMPIGATVLRGRRVITLRLHWDHMLPYSYSANNSTSNFAAACHVCNGIKSSMVFQTLDEAMVYIANKRKEKGYSF